MHLTVAREKEPNEPIGQYDFEPGIVAIGAAASCNVRLDGADIPECHSLLMPLQGNQWAYLPVSPSAPYVRNGLESNGRALLVDGDELVFGGYIVRFELESDDEEVVLPASTSTLDDLAKIKEHPLPRHSITRNADMDVTLGPARQNWLMIVAERLQHAQSYHDLLRRTLDGLLRAFGARRVWVGIRRDDKSPLEFTAGRTNDDRDFDEPPMFETFQYRCLQREQFILIPRLSKTKKQSVMALPVLAGRNILGMIVMTSRTQINKYELADLQLLSVLSKWVGVQIRRIQGESNQQDEAAQAERKSFLRELQSSLEPPEGPDVSPGDAACFNLRGTDRAGDLLDVTRLSNGMAMLLVGHVHGNEAQVIRTLPEIRAVCRTTCLHDSAPHVALTRLNGLMHDEIEPITADVALFLIDPRTGATEFVTAGRVGALLMDGRGGARSLLNPKSPAVGADKDRQFSGGKIRIPRNATLALFTAGCVRVCSEEGEALGEKRFLLKLSECSGQPAAATIEDVTGELSLFFKDGSAPDDISLVVYHQHTEIGPNATAT